MAHDLLQSSNENEDLENIGGHYLNDLLSRFFFQDFDGQNLFDGIQNLTSFHTLMIIEYRNLISLS
ncbi:hypothetical protein QQP08_017306 [Theobroma cacao]|nr:hypothetical protein QQP08_017306 [Theobroma cacao]